MITVTPYLVAAVASGFVLALVLVGAVFTVAQSRKRKKYDLETVGVNMPPLISGNNSVACAVQPSSEPSQSPDKSVLAPFKFWKKNYHDVTPDPVLNAGQGGPGNGYLGKINFTLGYDRDSFSLLIHLREAVDLPPRDFLTGSSDPYVRVMLLPEHQEVKVSKVHRRSLNPKFNQTLEFKGVSLKKLNEMTLCMQVIDYDRFSHDDTIGELLIPLKDIKLDRKPCYWKHLMSPTVHHKTVKGELMLSVCYLPDSDRITVVVIKAKDLPAKDMSGSSDPYVKLWLIHQGVKCEKKKTTTKMQTLTPVYNETFTFICPKDKVPEMQLVASVMDYDLIGGNDEIGHVILGKRGSETGLKHWKAILEQPGYPVAMWHPLNAKL